MVLGMRSDKLSAGSVIEAWKKQIANDGIYPEMGGDTEAASI